jgi:hypothetical protein
MQLDLAIQRELKRSPMENAMHGVSESLGAGYTLKALPQTMKSVDEMFGVNMGQLNSHAGAAPRITEKTVAPAFSEVVDGYNLSWDPSGSKWTLSMGETVSEEPTSLWGRLMNTLNGNDKSGPAIIIVKYGKGSAHRFLSALEPNDTITHETKLAIANRVVSTLNGELGFPTLQNGLTVTDNSQTQIAGTQPVSATNFNNGAMEMNMAETMPGTSKQRNATFMGDTIIPSPVSRAQVYQSSAATAFNQNTAGLVNRPPTKIPDAGKYTKVSRSL